MSHIFHQPNDNETRDNDERMLSFICGTSSAALHGPGDVVSVGRSVNLIIHVSGFFILQILHPPTTRCSDV